MPLELLAILVGQVKRDLAPTAGEESSLGVELHKQHLDPTGPVSLIPSK
jgi:hypothetical protein